MADILTTSIYRQTLTSITATINPKKLKKNQMRGKLEKLVTAGVTIFRFNLSYYEDTTDKKEHFIEILKNINDLAREKGIVLGVMLDTSGPEFRVGKLNSEVALKKILDDEERKCISYKKGEKVILKLVRPKLISGSFCDNKTIIVKDSHGTEFGEHREYVVFGDSKYQAKIQEVSRDRKSMKIEPEGDLHIWENSKVNFPGTKLTAPPIGEAEGEAIGFFLKNKRIREMGFEDFIFAQSFIKSPEDIRELIGLINGFGYQKPIIIAKMETSESVQGESLKDIIEKSSAVMIARGDLGNEISVEEVPQFQRRIVEVAKELGKPVLLATEVYKSMSKKGSHPTRPEAEDVRSALELGVDGFVLTSETTNRLDPQTVVKALAKQIKKDEKDLIERGYYEKMREPVREAFHEKMKAEMREDFPEETKAKNSTSKLSEEEKEKERRFMGTKDFAIAAVFRVNAYRAIGIFPFTADGGTVKEMCHFYPETQIFALTLNPKAAQLLLLYRCTHPILVEIDEKELDNFEIDELKRLVRDVVKTLKLRKKSSSDNDIAINSTSRYAIATMAHPALDPWAIDTLLRIRLDRPDGKTS